MIKTFVSIFKVDLNEAIRTNAEEYINFNDFFTRQLKPEVRDYKIGEDVILSPVDGSISQISSIRENSLIQAKDMHYTVGSLLANDAKYATRFTDGSFATLYLSPRDYHRIHMPVSGKLIKSIYVPGTLFPVNNTSVRTVNNLFARNERFISLFQTEYGIMAQIMVGAIFVGSMETVWLGQITPTANRTLTTNEYRDEAIELNQGDEFGRFNMGSTVILLFEKEKINWLPDLNEDEPIKVGQLIANTNKPH